MSWNNVVPWKLLERRDMIVVKIELWPFGIETSKRELGRLEIANDGTGTVERGNYNTRSYGKRSGRRLREGRVENWARKNRTVFALVRKALGSLRYDY